MAGTARAGNEGRDALNSSQTLRSRRVCFHSSRLITAGVKSPSPTALRRAPRARIAELLSPASAPPRRRPLASLLPPLRASAPSPSRRSFPLPVSPPRRVGGHVPTATARPPHVSPPGPYLRRRPPPPPLCRRCRAWIRTLGRCRRCGGMGWLREPGGQEEGDCRKGNCRRG